MTDVRLILIFSCPSWRNAAGKHIVVKSECVYGNYTRPKRDSNGTVMTNPDGTEQIEHFTGAHWKDSRPFPPGPLLIPPELNRPGKKR